MKLIFAVLDVSLTMGLTRCYNTEGFLYIYLNQRREKMKMRGNSGKERRLEEGKKRRNECSPTLRTLITGWQSNST